MKTEGYHWGKDYLSTINMKYRSIYNRLRRIEGQIRALEEMVADDKEERELLVQLEAAKSALSSTIVSLLEEMLKEESLEDGLGYKDRAKVDLLLKFLKK